MACVKFFFFLVAFALEGIRTHTPTHASHEPHHVSIYPMCFKIKNIFNGVKFVKNLDKSWKESDFKQIGFQRLHGFIDFLRQTIKMLAYGSTC